MSLCPGCGGDDVDSAVEGFDSEMARVGCSCLVCGKVWSVLMVPVVGAGRPSGVLSFDEGGRTTALFEVRLPGDGRPDCTVALSVTDDRLVVDVFGEDRVARAAWSPLASLWVSDSDLWG